MLTVLGPLVLAVAAAQEPPGVPTFASKVDLVTVDAIVQDGKGRPVRGLTVADFTLLEDGKPQTIVSFEAIDLGDAAAGLRKATVGPVATNAGQKAPTVSTYVLLVDDVGLAPVHEAVVRTAVARFLDAGLRDGDQLIYATTSGDAWWRARLPEGREDVRAVVGRLRGRSLADSGKDSVSEWEAFRIEHFEGRGEGGTATGIPTAPWLMPGMPSSTVAGVSLMDRVVERFYQRRVCVPDQIPGAPIPSPTTPFLQCRAMVRARTHLVDQRRVNRTRDVLAAVDRAVFALTGSRGRKALLLFTGGFLNDPDLGARPGGRGSMPRGQPCPLHPRRAWAHDRFVPGRRVFTSGHR